MKNYIWTISGFILASIIFITNFLFDFDLFESFTAFLESMEAYELDEYVLPLILLLLCALFDFIRLQKERKAEREKVDLYKAMVQASDHVLKSSLNEMLLIRMAADDIPDFDPQALEVFDESMKKAIKQLNALGQIDKMDASKIEELIDIKIFKGKD